MNMDAILAEYFRKGDELEEKRREFERKWVHRKPCKQYLEAIEEVGYGWCEHAVAASARKFRKEINEQWAMIGMHFDK